jgi:hypothetical protein
MSKRKPRLPITELERLMIQGLGYVTFLPGSFDKRFYRAIENDTWLTDKQGEYLRVIFEKYRRQIPDYDAIAMQVWPDKYKVKIDNTLFGTEIKIEKQ